MNQWGRAPLGKDSRVLVFGIVIIGIIGYLFLPNLFKAIYASLAPPVAPTNLSNLNLTSPNDPNASNSPNPLSPLFPSINNASNLGKGNNTLAPGYGVLFVSNGLPQQLSVNTQDYAFLQELFLNDNNGIGTSTVFLVDNGQIWQYNVSKETYAIIANLASIKTRATSSSTTVPSTTTPSTTTPSTTAPSTTTPSTPISETLTVSTPSISGFTVVLNPGLLGLTISNFTLLNNLGSPVALTAATSSVDGTTYVLTAALNAGQTYTLTALHTGYTFGTAQNVVIPE